MTTQEKPIDLLRNKWERDELVEMLYCDVKHQLIQAQHYVNIDMPKDEIKNLTDVYAGGGGYDLKFFDAYLSQIHLLPPNQSNLVINFYRGLSIVNSWNIELKDRANYLPEQRKKLMLDAQEKNREIIKTAEMLIRSFKHTYRLK